MTCKEIYDFLMNYIDGELPPAVLKEFERHLTLCPPCVCYLKSYQQAVRLGKLCAGKKDAPAEACAPEELVQAILKSLAKGTTDAS